MQQGGSAAEYIEVHPARVTVIRVDEPENLPVSNSSTSTVSPTPDGTNRPDTGDSVKTNASGPHSASSGEHLLLSV